MKRSRYGVKRARTSDGRSYASAWERECAANLRLMEKAGAISDLKEQVSFALVVNGITIERYIADFVYTDKRTGLHVVADAKNGLITADYKRKRKWMKAAHGITITELHKRGR